MEPEGNINEAANGSASVVVRIGSSVPNLATIETAARVAKAFSLTLEGLIVEDEAIRTAATYSFTREISYVSGRTRAITTARVEAEWRSTVHAAQQRLARLAHAYQLPLHFRTQQRAAASSGQTEPEATPHFLALSQASVVTGGRNLFDLISEAPAADGFILAGAMARRRPGPVLMLTTDARDFATLRPVLERLLAVASHSALIVPMAADPRLLEALQQELSRRPIPACRLLAPLVGSPGALDRIVRRANASLVLLPLDHPIIASRSALAHLVATLTTPLLLIRSPVKR